MTDFNLDTDVDTDLDTDEPGTFMDDGFAELYAELVESDTTDEGVYNLPADADADCLTGDCEHFCGEPTQADLDRFYARGLGHLVEAYENGIQYI
jgi:hypothetical protein